MRPPGASKDSFYKIIDLVDDSGIRMNMYQGAPPDEVIEAQERVLFILSRLVDAIFNHEFEKARFYSDQESRERENLRLLLDKYKIDEWGQAC
jgi:ATP-dependent Clp protease ATP-binding subunit ClpC